MHTTHRLLARLLMCALLSSLFPVTALAAEPAAPYQQEFIITAYYSPLPDQCCYVKGSFGADMILNGEGEHGADGTEVYPGMAAAPKSFAFGTRINLPGIGTVTVHDRGGAIQDLKNNVARLDLWVGKGEEGLARALAFGVRHVTATVYPVGSKQPANALDLTVLAAPLETLRAFATSEPSLLSLRADKGDRSLSVKLLQQQLQKLGYLDTTPNGNFGDATQTALKAFNTDMGLNEPSDSISERTAAFLAVMAGRSTRDALAFLTTTDPLRPDDIATIKRSLRYLGFYKGRTNTLVSKSFTDAVIAFQKSKQLITDASDSGAGTMGPRTRKALRALWLQHIVAGAAEQLLFTQRIAELVDQKGLLVSDFIGVGDSGADVRRLQQFLAAREYLSKDKVTGTFGKETEKALIAYQKQSGIITHASSRGAGFAGPATLAQIRSDTEKDVYRLVRSQGWNVL